MKGRRSLGDLQRGELVVFLWDFQSLGLKVGEIPKEVVREGRAGRNCRRKILFKGTVLKA